MAIAALSFTVLTSWLSLDSWQKPVPPGPTQPSSKPHARAGCSHSLSSRHSNNQSSDIPAGTGGRTRPVGCASQDRCNPQGQAGCRGTLLHFHPFVSKMGRTGKKTTGKSKILGLVHSSCASQVHGAALYQAQSCLKSMKKNYILQQVYQTPVYKNSTSLALKASLLHRPAAQASAVVLHCWHDQEPEVRFRVSLWSGPC